MVIPRSSLYDFVQPFRPPFVLGFVPRLQHSSKKSLSLPTATKMSHSVMSGSSALAEDSFFGDDFGAQGSKIDNEFSLVEMSSTFFKDGEFSDEAYLGQNRQYLESLETIRQLKQRLKRRTEIIDEIRRYYLRDIVTVKYIMRDVLSNTERETIYKQYESMLPSLDLKKALILHAPQKTELAIKLCNECGGHLEIISRDSDEVEMLKKVLSEARERENRWRVKLASMDSEIEDTSREKAEANKSHFEEVFLPLFHCTL